MYLIRNGGINNDRYTEKGKSPNEIRLVNDDDKDETGHFSKSCETPNYYAICSQ